MSQIDTKLLQNHWIQSFEDSTDKEMVFRPASYKFDPSRQPRTHLDLKPGGNLVFSDQFGPDDKLQKEQSTWKLDHDVLILHDKGSNQKKHKILSIAPDKLVLEN
jgi:hypothetical protein